MFDSEVELLVEKEFIPFLSEESADYDVKVKIRCEENKISNPQEYKRGADLLMEYYEKDGQVICLTKGGIDGYISKTVCDVGFSELECSIYCRHMESMKKLGAVLRLIPMNIILQKKGILFFHASQIEIHGKGVLFTAPSGTGKTTQAKLWNKYRGSRIICNDRTLIGNGNTYGFPVDGSEPVWSGEILSLGAIVLLGQGKENTIERLSAKEVVKLILPQLLIASWAPLSRVLAMEQLISVMENCPIYFLNCIPDESAVQCLEQQLIIDGVVENV